MLNVATGSIHATNSLQEFGVKSSMRFILPYVASMRETPLMRWTRTPMIDADGGCG